MSRVERLSARALQFTSLLLLSAGIACAGWAYAYARSNQLPPRAHAAASSVTRTRAPRVPLGLNLGELSYYASIVPFADAMKTADAFQTTTARMDGPWDTRLSEHVPSDAVGYPLEIPYVGPDVAQPQIARFSVAKLLYPGRYTVLFDGDGELAFPASPVQVIARAPGRIALEAPAHDGPLFISITRSNPRDHVHNVRVLLPGFEAVATQQPLHPRFIEQVRGAAVLRFMDWQRTNDSPLSSWRERTTPHMSQGTVRGAAIETILEVANRIDADPWLCIPHKADDAYIENMAKLVRDRMAKGHVAYIEYSNEVWNGIFSQYHYAAEQGCKAGLNRLPPYAGSCDDDGTRMWAGMKWQAKRSARSFEIFERVFGGSERLVRVLAGQASWSERNELLLEAFNSRALNPHGVRADALAIAPYFGGGVADAIADAKQSATISEAQILARAGDTIDEQVGQASRDNMRVARRFGLRLVAYEGGQHLVATGANTGDQTLTDKLINANRAPAMQHLYERMFDAWYAASGNDLMVLFNSAAQPSKFGSWGLLESQEQPPERAPKYLAFRQRLVELALRIHARARPEDAP